MAVTTIDLDMDLVNRARELTGSSSNRAVIDLALRRLIAFHQKGAMLRGIAELGFLADGIDAPKIDYPHPEPR